MSPLEIEILLHYYGRADEYRGGDFSAPAVRAALDRFVKADELLKSAAGTERGQWQTYTLTERGLAYVDALMQMPLPVCVWVIPTNPIPLPKVQP